MSFQVKNLFSKILIVKLLFVHQPNLVILLKLNDAGMIHIKINILCKLFIEIFQSRCHRAP